jgi:hypothetical protein
MQELEKSRTREIENVGMHPDGRPELQLGLLEFSIFRVLDFSHWDEPCNTRDDGTSGVECARPLPVDRYSPSGGDLQ